MRAFPRGLAGAALLAALAAAGCGKKLAPQAPLQVIPARVEPLRVVQEGTDAVLRFPYPSQTAQGEPLTDLTRVTVLREVVPAQPGARPPEPAKDAAQRARDERSFLARAEKVQELARGDLDDATDGADVVARDSLVPLFLEKRAGRVFMRYAVTATRDRKRVSELSPIVSLRPLVPPDTPLRLAATVEEGRVCLDWLPPAAMLGGETPVKVAAYAVYRREEGEDSYGNPLGVERLGPTFVDETAQPGKHYLYTVRAAPAKDEPLALGPPADEVRVDTADVFPPPPPEGVLALAEQGANRLVWNPVLAPDLAGYRVYRRDAPGAPWKLLLDNLKDPSAIDRGAPAGAEYAVTAFDKLGNESAKAEPAGR